MNAIIAKPGPDPKGVYITAKDRRTGKAKCMTIYGVTPAQAIRMIRRSIEANGNTAPDQEPDQQPAGRSR